VGHRRRDRATLADGSTSMGDSIFMRQLIT
jgi:hypothetical protein